MNSRRSFFKQLLSVGGAFAILPPATTYERIWRVERKVITLAEFTQVLLNEVPLFDPIILQEIYPAYTWVGAIESEGMNACHAKLANYSNPL